MSPPQLVEHFFRHEYGKLVASLTGRLGAQHLQAAEDAAQAALMTALERWRVVGPPDNPSAWLFRVASNNVKGAVRGARRRRQLLERNLEESDALHPSVSDMAAEPLLPDELQDDMLRMLFVCCDGRIAEESRRVLALKTLCGFGVREIALRLFMTEANVYKRLGRARSRLRAHPPSFENVSFDVISSRLPVVQQVLYVLFTEGYLSSHGELSIRAELCSEAIRLATVLAEHPAGQTPETYALLALMHLQLARIASRQDGGGGLLLLEEQDRALWDQNQICTGLNLLAKSAKGELYSRYHAEAGIAAEHCLAPSFGETRWERVVAGYALLERVSPSAVHRLNRAVALAEWKGPAAGLALLEGFQPPGWLVDTHGWSAVIADLHKRCGHTELAEQHLELALKSAPTEAIRALLQRRLSRA